MCAYIQRPYTASSERTHALRMYCAHTNYSADFHRVHVLLFCEASFVYGALHHYVYHISTSLLQTKYRASIFANAGSRAIKLSHSIAAMATSTIWTCPSVCARHSALNVRVGESANGLVETPADALQTCMKCLLMTIIISSYAENVCMGVMSRRVSVN